MSTQFSALNNSESTGEKIDKSGLLSERLPLYLSIYSPTHTIMGAADTSASSTRDHFNSELDYYWDNYSDHFSLNRYYRRIKNYERNYGFSSKLLLKKWTEGEPIIRDSYMNDWLVSYLQAKDYIHE